MDTSSGCGSASSQTTAPSSRLFVMLLARGTSSSAFRETARPGGHLRGLTTEHAPPERERDLGQSVAQAAGFLSGEPTRNPTDRRVIGDLTLQHLA
jgi:hypothetical protein